jgi:hypothetical protein
MRAVLLGTMAIVLGACTVKPKSTLSTRALDLPFDPTTIAATPGGPLRGKGPYPIELAVNANRSLTAADAITLRVVVAGTGGTAVASVPVVIEVPPGWNGGTSKAFSAVVEVPAGDYEVELVRGDAPILGHAFKLAEVPVWGGGRQVHFFSHQNTRIDLDTDTLRLARWVVEDEPTQGWIIEWWQRGKRVITTKGRSPAWPAFELAKVVQSATSKDAARPTIWTYGAERYTIPKDLILIGGQWEARVYREGAPPVSVTFELAIAPETQESRVAAIGLKLSSPLFLRPLPEGLGADAFVAIPGKQQPTSVVPASRPLIDPITFDRSAVRAMFRSPELARKWRDFLSSNSTVESSGEQVWNLTAAEKREAEKLAKAQRGRDPAKVDAERLARVKRLRPEIVALIRKYDGPWQPSDIPE